MAAIAVATDFSTRSDRALARAAILAKANCDELLLIHVIDDDQPATVVSAHRLEAEKLLHDLTRSVSDLSGVPCRSEIVLGDPFQQIAAAGAGVAAALLVMGPHRRQVLRDQFRGTTVERTIRLSTIPVLVANALPARDYVNVLLTTDLSPESASALEMALSLPFLKESNLALIHVFEPLAQRALGRALASPDEIEDYVADETARAAAALREFSQESRFGRVHTVPYRLRQSIEQDVLDAARERNAQLVVVGSGRKRFLESVMLGSVAEGILRDAECDVLVIPGAATER
jgi:nucleotide-binding universal stress UspA family protein